MRKITVPYIISVVLGLAVTLILIGTIPLLKDQYRIVLTDRNTALPEEYCFFDDLNSDGISERLIIYYNNAGNLAISISDIRTEGTINQFNLPGELPELGATLDLHDINSDGKNDIFVVTEKNDSLFLNIIDDLYGHPTRSMIYFLDRLRQYNDNADYNFISGELGDLNGDGSPEYIFGINGGYALQPRRIYALDYRNEKVLRSPISGAALTTLDLFDLNQDGSDEVLISTVAPENFKTPFPYSDSVSWFMVLDPALQFLFPPVEMGSPPSWLTSQPIVYEGRHYLLTLQRFQEPSGNYSSKLTLYDDQVHPLENKYIRGFKKGPLELWVNPDNPDLSELWFFKDEWMYKMNLELEWTDSIKNKAGFYPHMATRLDIDGDGSPEYIQVDVNKLMVVRSGFGLATETDITWQERVPRILISKIDRPKEKPILFAQIGTEQLRFLYGRNPWYRFRFLVYPVLFVLLSGIFYALLFLQDKLVSRRYERDRLISRLQLMSIKNQLDPHFTYNALNAVGSLIYKEEKELAYHYLKGLTDLLRMVSGDAATITWTLGDELRFVRKYLDIEKLRFREKFSYEVNVEQEEMKDLQIPKMCILTFVENAIKHGLRHKKGSWLLEILVKPSGKAISVSIRDNGIGRAAAVKYREESSGQGIDMMEQYFRQFSEATGKKAEFSIIDLVDQENRASGTLVEITIS